MFVHAIQDGCQEAGTAVMAITTSGITTAAAAGLQAQVCSVLLAEDSSNH